MSHVSCPCVYIQGLLVSKLYDIFHLQSQEIFSGAALFIPEYVQMSAAVTSCSNIRMCPLGLCVCRINSRRGCRVLLVLQYCMHDIRIRAGRWWCRGWWDSQETAAGWMLRGKVHVCLVHHLQTCAGHKTACFFISFLRYCSWTRSLRSSSNNWRVIIINNML